MPFLDKAALAALCIGIAGPALAQDAEQPAEFPPYSVSYEPTDIDERGLWQSFDEVERRVKTSKDLIRDEGLNSYLKQVLCDSVGSDRCDAVRIYIVRDSSFNASMAPNGMMIVNSGLLLRMRNEAELASVLGHEFAHFEQRHSLRIFQKLRGSTDIMAVVSGVVGVPIGSLFLLDVFSFNRDMEVEADLLSAEYLAASAYPSQASADLWVRMIDEDEVRAVERKRRSRNRRGAWFDSHPAPKERSVYLAEAAAEYADVGDFRVGPYASALDTHLLTFYEDQLQRNDFAASEFILDEVAGDNWRAIHYVMEGELHRKRGEPSDLVTAEDAYREAIFRGTELPAAWRGLGLTLMRARRKQEGADVLATYLEKAPDAPDAPMMQMMIKGSQ
ncbi:M48 family metallopeptidase [Erythrobacter crassostreae]|uniref:M48 family metalloprotease n=1 Tax=Erythrobacter crassostreae TaxID=2828328 RepID=A0A9X1F2R2_9SPHN|nr:M48 family metallopeptidase [Erythrobacter crassostrea]MBV7259231.1 M48 family metalloprotease [Erythrobacter crassostrea]